MDAALGCAARLALAEVCCPRLNCHYQRDHAVVTTQSLSSHLHYVTWYVAVTTAACWQRVQTRQCEGNALFKTQHRPAPPLLSERASTGMRQSVMHSDACCAAAVPSAQKRLVAAPGLQQTNKASLGGSNRPRSRSVYPRGRRRDPRQRRTGLRCRAEGRRLADSEGPIRRQATADCKSCEGSQGEGRRIAAVKWTSDEGDEGSVQAGARQAGADAAAPQVDWAAGSQR